MPFDPYAIEPAYPPLQNATDDALSRAVEACAQEEIRLPGSIQAHGFLLAYDPATERVVAASENAPAYLGFAMRLILGATLDALLEREPLSAVRSLSAPTRVAVPVRYLGSFHVRGELFSVVSHMVDGLRVLEMEKLQRLVRPELMNDVVTNFVTTLSKLSDPLELCRAMTRQVFELTGMDRVLLYSFDVDGHGTVLTEENSGALPSYAGLRFPASDIPAQARALYVQNTVRIIPDAWYKPSALTGLPGTDARKLDLSQSILRSVSPVHLAYMKNMGTAASMSISILSEGRLWGLISAHNATPCVVPYLIRSACDLLSRMGSTRLEALFTEARLRSVVRFHGVQRSVLTLLASESDYIGALLSQAEELIQVTAAAGCAVMMDDRVATAGLTPGTEAISRIADWLDARDDTAAFASRELHVDFPEAAAWRDAASGLLAVRTSNVRRGYILWFRPEVVNTVTWAGEPVKRPDEDGRLNPRQSFEAWKETQRGRAEQWTVTEVESAEAFRSALLTISLKRAEEAAELSESRFLQLTQALPTVVWTTDAAGSLTYVNDGWKKLGLSPSGVWFEAAHMTRDDCERIRSRWQAWDGRDKLFEDEVRLRTAKGGKDRWHLVRAVAVTGRDGSRAGWVGTFTDLTDRREREAALRMADKLATTGRMTSVIAHEINNPLESMTNLMYLLSNETRGNPAAEKYVRMVEHELERVSAITKQTLRWSRESRPVAETVTVGSLWDELLRLFAGKIRNRSVSVKVISGAEVQVYGVIPQLRQVLTNLLSNAVEAVPVGGAVELSAKQTEHGCEIDVRDYGAGMTDSVRERLFEPFFSTKGDLGNGLGLYISQEIVNQHGGQLTVQTEAGQGTVMRVVLPGAPE